MRPTAIAMPSHFADDAPDVSWVIDHSDNAVVVCDEAARITWINQGFTRMLGYTLEEAVGRRPSDFLAGPHTDPETVEWVRGQLNTQQGYRTELLVYAKNGVPLWISAVVNPVYDPDRNVRYLLGVYTDITHSKLHEELHRKVLGAIIREQPLQDVMTLVCREVEKVMPEAVASVIGLDDYGRLRPLAAPSLPDQIAVIIDGELAGPMVGACGSAAWSGQPVECSDIERDPRWQAYNAPFLALGIRACWSNPVKGHDGRVLGTFALYYWENRAPDEFHQRVVDVCLHLCALAIERDRARARMHQLSFFDTLTGLPNRALFNSKVEQMLLGAARRDSAVALLFIDIDRFKIVNDTQGHSAGDTLLRELAKRLGGELREGDVVARLAGDEFVLAVPDRSAEEAASLADRLMARLAEPVIAGRMMLTPQASIGVAMFPADGWDVDSLVRHADIAMYRAKSEGGARIVFYSLEMNQAMQERLALENALREAVRSGQLRLHYQPQVVLDDDARLHGVEALLRWRHPEIGEISPATFVPMAEECGLIDELGRWTLEEACTQMADWRRRGVPVPRVSVNLSAINFEQQDLPAFIGNVLGKCGLSPDELMVEVTESVMLAQKPEVLANIDAIHRMGVHLSIDDFGTGYSSLSHLHRLPISELKLDMSFVRDLEHSESARALTTSILRIGESLSLKVVAEGVENAAQRAVLASLDCDLLQGYYVSRPLSPHSLERWISLQPPPAA
ncbi:sensor domain-containing protein [Pseudoxanthomonas mexicana]|uniref:sensor domain-containing protein n=1 Tax=Pseudoxanthomonas mexicana TaxID=128785 RepID=UPI0022F3F0DD|nr:EAL domain-containing protein [Pseudoxanthomonas mexicana]WBX94415.1 EAL domain-containing protein [Pseudoxanthomonas mexicana]